MLAQVLLVGRKAWKVLKISLYVLEGVLALGVMILVLANGRVVLPDLRPCTRTTTGCPAEHRDSGGGGSLCVASFVRASSCGER